MTKEENGDPRSSVQTEQSAPKEFSSTPKQMKVSQTNAPSSGTRKTISLLECEVDVTTGETKHCRRIPIYDETVPAAGVVISENLAKESSDYPTPSNEKKGCTLTTCELKQRKKKWQNKTAQ